MMTDHLTLYYYTAWDGFAWQGCDAETAKSLQAYMEATHTLPKTSADVPPFGGAVACKIAGQFGVAVYRYLTRKKGDLSGRDSLYLALAFVPLSAGCVDFSAVLALPQMNTPQPGALQPQALSLSQQHLRLADTPSELRSWWEKDVTDTEYHVLKGKQGLRRLSTLFFSPFTQLGFLMAVFRSDAGLDDLVSTQSYSVFPEVADVVRETAAVRRARELNGGVLERNHPAILKMKTAFARLQQWADKQAGYTGLSAYYHEQMEQMDDQDSRLKKLEDFIRDRELALRELQKIRVVEKRYLSDIAKYVDGAREILRLPILDHESYQKAMEVSLEVLVLAATLLERESGASALEQETAKYERAEYARKMVEAEKNACEQVNRKLRMDLAQSQKDLNQLKAELAKLKVPSVPAPVTGSGLGQTRVAPSRPPEASFPQHASDRGPSHFTQWLYWLAIGGLFLSLLFLLVVLCLRFWTIRSSSSTPTPRAGGVTSAQVPANPLEQKGIGHFESAERPPVTIPTPKESKGVGR